MATRRREGEGGGGGNDGGMEENTMAILDSSCFSTSSQHLSDDRLTYLEAVRSNSIAPENASAPTKKMYEAIFHILKDESSLDLIMASYQLLNDLDKRFPRVSLSETDKSESSSPSTSLHKLVVVEEAWSPFTFNQDFSSSEKRGDDIFIGSLDASGFHLLIQDIGKGIDKATPEALESKFLRNMLLLQYLVNVLEADFLSRNSAFKENMNWILLRESLLNMLLGSRRIIYKGLIKDSLSVMCEMSQCCSETPVEVPEKCDSALAIALPEVVNCSCTSVQKLLLMIMELDSSKKTADIEGLTTRSDGVRTPAVEIILDELTYDRDLLSSFFQVFDEPRWKLDIIVLYLRKYIPKVNFSSLKTRTVQYLRKYIPKSSARTRRSNGSKDDATFGGVLKCFSNSNSIKSNIKKIGPEEAQLLLAHGFQAYFSLPAQHSPEGMFDTTEGGKGSSLVEICKDLISAFTCLRRTDESVEILPFGKEALFTAATILSRSS